MHILENLALNCGCKIDKPKIQQVYIPLEFKNYITIDNGDLINEKSYDFFNAVIKIIKPFLIPRGIKIVQISKTENTNIIHGIDRECCGTTFRQKAYLVYHSKLHVCVDSFSAQISGIYDKKTVFVPSVLFSGNSKPFFSSPKNLKIVETDLDMKPSLFTPEQIKRINQAKPEDIARSILDSLGIPFDFPYETVFLGNDMTRIEVDSIPNASFRLNSQETINLRVDYFYNEMNIASQLNLNKCHIITNKIIPINLLQNFRHKITKVTYIIDDNNDPQFVNALKQMGIKIMLMTYDEEKIKDYKLAYMDYGTVFLKKRFCFDNLKNSEANKDLKIEELYYVSNKILQNEDRLYPGFLASVRKQDSESLAREHPDDPIRQIVHKAEDNDFFWRDISSYWILRKT